MFNRPRTTPAHLIDTTLPPKDTIELVYINRCNESCYKIPNPFAQPTFNATNLSAYFGNNGILTAHRIGKQARPLVKERLEKSFCAVIVADSNEVIATIIIQLRFLLIDSTKWPHIILVTPWDLVFNKNYVNIAVKQVKLIDMQDLPQSTSILLSAVTPTISELLHDAAKETSISTTTPKQ